jgi:branched-chain amino acid aminotransferase
VSVVWFNGSFVEGSVSIDSADRGLTLGDGLFETIAVHNQKPEWLAEHILRMRSAAEELGIGFDAERITRGISDILQKSTAQFEVLRITLTRGTVTPRALSGTGIAPNLLMTLSPFDPLVPLSVSLATSTIRRNHSAPSSRLKTLSYIDAIAAAREVTARADDALMLNTAGHVASTTIGNIFLVKGRQLITPDSSQGILCGIVRQKLLGIATALGYEPHETVVTMVDLISADGIFRTNSLRLITVVSMLDGKPFANQPIQEIKDKLNCLAGRT